MSPGRLALVAVGVVAHLAVGFVLLVSGLVFPIWAWAAMLAVWVVGFVLQLRWKHVPLRVLAVPVATALLWAWVAWVGDTVLGWTA